MATYDEMSLSIRLFMRNYPFRRHAVDPVPCAPLRKPLPQARLVLVTTAGLHTAAEPPFDARIKMGDTSFREISDSADLQTLIESHKSQSFDHAGIEADRNVAFPLDRLHEMAGAGAIGSLNHRHFSFMGSIINPAPLLADSAPAVADLLRRDGVDVAVLTPV